MHLCKEGALGLVSKLISVGSYFAFFADGFDPSFGQEGMFTRTHVARCTVEVALVIIEAAQLATIDVVIIVVDQ